MSSLAEFVKSRRIELGLSQTDIEREVGLPQAYLSGIERGRILRPTEEFRSRLARALQISDLELIMAIEGIDRHEAERWAREFGMPPSQEASWLTTVSARLTDEEESSPRVQLAQRVPWLTQREAKYLLDSLERLPTDGLEKRRELAGDFEAFRRWRNRQDQSDKQ